MLPQRTIRHLILGTFVLFWILAFVLTHVPGNDLPEFRLGDKWLHLIGFLGLGTMLLATLTSYRLTRFARLATMLAVLPIYAALDELTQPPFHRSCDFLDWTFDVLGVLAAALLVEGVHLMIRAVRARGLKD